MRLLLILWLMRCLLILNTVKVLAKKLEITEGKAFSKKTICEATEFDCGDGTCISEIYVCNLIPNCANGADEETLLCHSYGVGCAPNEFACGDGSCITDELVCDGTPECNNGADETEDVCVVLICDPYNTITYDKVCDGISDCDNNRDEINCKCLKHEFLCANDICIIELKRCDGANDCGDFSDEANCPGTCGYTKFACGDGTCISNDFVCDQVVNCGNGADEDSQRCGGGCAPNQFACGYGTCILPEHVCDGSPDCINGADEGEHVCGGFTCDQNETISYDKVCDGIQDCNDGSDEMHCGCLNGEFSCANGKCVNEIKRCNYLDDCGDSSDEANCEDTCEPTEFACGDGACISDSFVCDGALNCANGADEDSQLCVVECETNQFACGDGACILHEHVCDGFPDCNNAADESQHVCGGFPCDQNEMISYEKLCDGVQDCNDGSDEIHCFCLNGEFSCANGKCVNEVKRCNYLDDCGDSSDEANCEDTCEPTEFACGDGTCISNSFVCDGAVNCANGADEDSQLCECASNQFACGDGTCVINELVCDGYPDCTNSADEDQHCGYILCDENKKVSLDKLCDGISDCNDFKDEIHCFCLSDEFRCVNGQCIKIEALCNSIYDCADGSDESNCHGCPPNQFTCGDGACILHEHICDGHPDCTDASDEDQHVCGCAPNQFTCGDGACILHENVCDGYPNCTDASDEDPHVCDNPPTACQETKGSRDCLYFLESPEEHNESAEFLKATLKGERSIEKRLNKSKVLFKGNFVAKPGSATWVHQSLLNATSNTTTIINAIAIERATLVFLNILNCDGVDEEHSCNLQKIFNVTFKKTTFGQKYCHAPITCPTNDTYRTYDGSCNNANDPLLGKAGTPLMRLLPPAYQDFFKLKEPRTKGSDGTILPSARKVSQLLKVCNGSQDTTHTMMLIYYAQFIDHDISLPPTAKLEFNGAPIECCTTDSSGKLRFPQRHKECLPILVDKKDSYYGCLKKRCMNFVRTLSAPSTGCTFGPRQQVNDVSHFLDASNIYGSSSDTANSLRAFSGGRLLVNKDADNIDMLPPQTNGGHCKPSPEYCYKAGDSRVNEQPFLALTHTLWVREHNRIADHFTRTGNNDEEAFQKARRLVTAELHQITFNEFLPHILGSVYTSARNLSSSPAGQYYRGYSPFTDARVSNSFATAAFRMGHSAVPDILEKRWPDFALPTKLPLSSMFFNQGLNHYWVNRMMFALGLIQQHPEKVDACFSTEVTQKLFEESSPGSGLDLFSLDIQRGRDHGLPGYVEYRNNFCNCDKKIYSFGDMDWLSESIKSLLTNAYKNVEDVDLIVGGLLEPPEPGALVGETFQCIIGDQFHSLKAGDRYYFENNRQPFPFTIKQLDAIRNQVSLARIICDNGDGISKIQTNVFESSESLVACNNFSSIPQLDLSLFS